MNPFKKTYYTALLFVSLSFYSCQDATDLKTPTAVKTQETIIKVIRQLRLETEQEHPLKVQRQ